MSNSDQEINIDGFQEFFNEMFNRVKEKQSEYGDSWKECDIEYLRLRLMQTEIKWYMLTRRGVNATKELVDIANFAMFLWLRHKMKKES